MRNEWEQITEDGIKELNRVYNYYFIKDRTLTKEELVLKKFMISFLKSTRKRKNDKQIFEKTAQVMAELK